MSLTNNHSFLNQSEYINEREGYRFAGWKTEDDDTLYINDIYSDPSEYPEGTKWIGSYVVDSDVTFKAEWDKEWEVTFDANGGVMSYDYNSETDEYDIPINIQMIS